jgi:peptidoglycan hydrolase-like protein with peptidoglycan-binding domain
VFIHDHPWERKGFDLKSVGLLRKGSKGHQVELLQHWLRKYNPTVLVDGDFGPGTERVVRAFQLGASLVVDGIVGVSTLGELRRLKPSKPLIGKVDLEAAACQLEISLSAMLAIYDVESARSGFMADWRPDILFERHVMYRQLIANGIDPKPAMVQFPNLVNRAAGGYRGGIHEYTRLYSAQAIHVQSALESCSWGAFQIMGYHWKVLGYSSVENYVEQMKASEANHLDAFVRFVKVNPGLHQAIKDHQWERVARLYNGPGYANHPIPYDIRLEKRYTYWRSTGVA